MDHSISVPGRTGSPPQSPAGQESVATPETQRPSDSASLTRRPDGEGRLPPRVPSAGNAATLPAQRPACLGSAARAAPIAAQNTLAGLPSNALAIVLQAGEPGTQNTHRFALPASLAQVNHELCDSVRHNGLLPPIGEVMFDADLVFSNSQRHDLCDRLAQLRPADRTIALTLLAERLDRIGPGNARTLKFAAMAAATQTLDAVDGFAALVRLTHQLPLLVQDAATPDCRRQFRALLQRAMQMPPLQAGALMLALAEQTMVLPPVRQYRTQIIDAMARTDQPLAPQTHAQLLCSLTRASVGIDDFEDRTSLFETIFRKCEALPSSRDKASVLKEFVRHVGIMGEPLTITFMMRVCTATTTLADIDQVEVLMQMTRLLGALRPHIQPDATLLLTTMANMLPPAMVTQFHALMQAQSAPPDPATPENLLSEFGTLWINPQRNLTSARINQLPAQEQLPTLLTLIERFDSSLPPAIRTRKFAALHMAIQRQPVTAQASLLPLLAQRLHFLPATRSLAPARYIRLNSLEFEQTQQARVIGALAENLKAIPGSVQEYFLGQLVMQATGLTEPAARAEAMLAAGTAIWHLGSQVTRIRLTQEVHDVIMQLPLTQQLAVLPDWIRTLSRFTAHVLLDETLGLVRHQILQSTADAAAIAPVLHALACNMGECQPATREAASAEIRAVAQTMPHRLGRPILSVLDRVADPLAATGQTPPDTTQN